MFWDTTAGRMLTFCSSGTTCATQLSEPAAGSHAIVAFVGASASATLASGAIAPSDKVSAKWLAVSLSASAADLHAGSVVHLSALSNVELTNNTTVTYAFTGLNPNRKYSFKAGAVRGLAPATATNKWTQVEINGANSFSSAHSSHVILPAQEPGSLASNQVAINFATNHISGDMIDWEDIVPSGSGTFSVVCQKYNGTVPNGGSSGNR